jgi:hypothetical protein
MIDGHGFYNRERPAYRCDYAKFKARVDYDQAQVLSAIWQHTETEYRVATRCDGGAKISALGPGDGDKRLYAFEVWGELSEMVHLLPFELFIEHVDRLDVRQAVNMADDGREELYQHLAAGKVKGRMLTKYSSRRRTKQGGRHAGGQGFAVGSHKSDFRFSVYQRGDEPGAVEFQMSGKRVERALSNVWQIREERPSDADWFSWADLLRTLHRNGWSEAVELAGLGRGDMLAIIAGDTQAPKTPEELIQAAELSIGKLTPEQRQHVYQVLQLQLFPRA